MPYSGPSRNGPSVTPLTTGDACLLLKRAGLTACDLAKIAEATRYGWTAVRTWLAMFDYASIKGRGFYGRYETLAARLGVSQRQVERLLPALAEAGLASKQQAFGGKAVWWPRHPTTQARLPMCEAAAAEAAEQPEKADSTLVSPNSAILTEPATRDGAANRRGARHAGDDGGPTAQSPENTLVSPNSANTRTTTTSRTDEVLRTSPVLQESSSTKKGSSRPRPPASNKVGVEAAGLVGQEKHQGDDARLERVPPRALGFHGGVAVMVGRSSLGEYVLYDHPRLKAAHAQFIDAPGALDMDLEQAVAVADARLRGLEDAWSRVQDVVGRYTPGAHAADRASVVLDDLFTPARTDAFDDALALMCSEEDLRRVIDATEAANRHLPFRLRDERIDLAKVVGAMVQVPAPEAYVTMLEAKGLQHPAQVFHPATLARAKREMVSVFDTAASRNIDAYAAQLRARGFE